jgi:hypothetical protein
MDLVDVEDVLNLMHAEHIIHALVLDVLVA